jgi:hypothetical protein
VQVFRSLGETAHAGHSVERSKLGESHIKNE